MTSNGLSVDGEVNTKTSKMQSVIEEERLAERERVVAGSKNNSRTAEDRPCLVRPGKGASGAQTGVDQAAPFVTRIVVNISLSRPFLLARRSIISAVASIPSCTYTIHIARTVAPDMSRC